MKRIILTTLCIGVLLLSACSETNPTTTPVPNETKSTSTLKEQATPKYEKWMDEVTNAWVVAHRYDWDADAEDEGIRVWVELLDKNEEMLEYQNVEIPIKIEIFSTESKTFPWKPSRLIYSISTALHDWHDDAFVTGAIGVKDIEWEEISLPLAHEQQEYGLIYVTVTLPNGRHYNARYDEARITKPFN